MPVFHIMQLRLGCEYRILLINLLTEENKMNFQADIARSDAYIESRASFIIKTYLHLFAAIIAFVCIEGFLFVSGLAAPIASALLSVNWLIPLGLFIAASWIASRFANTSDSLPMQYLGLFLFIIAECVIFVPLLAMASFIAPGVIMRAGAVTLLGATGLTMIAFYTRKDFSFLGGFIGWSIICAIILIVASAFFGFNLGTWFAVAMIAVAGGAILYDTSNIIHNFPEERYVGAALQLFASIAMMFWYVLQFMLSFSSSE